jgi:hypothetical protein
MKLFPLFLSLLSFTYSYAADCILVMPAFPLTLNGLLTPYRLQSLSPADPCIMENPKTTTFVEATLFDPDTGHISVYHPLIVNDGTMPLVPPTVFTLPTNAIVSLSFGTNANTLKLTPPEILVGARCVNGITGNDLFGQFAYCNSDLLYHTVQMRLDNGMDLIPPIPSLGLANDGKECMTTRHFMLVDQDPSDNLVTTYLVDPVTMRIFQDTVSNRQAHPGFIILKNGSDNRLLVTMNLAMGCTGYLAPLLSDPSGAKTSSMVLNEIHASMRQENPMVMIPSRDPMARVIINGNSFPSMLKNNLYRKGVNQPQLTSIQQADSAPFCGHLTNQLVRLQDNKALFTTQLSPDPAAATNLFTFLSTRLFQTYNNLKCDTLLDQANPVTLIMANGVTTDATFTAIQAYQFYGQDPYFIVQPTLAPTQPPITDPPTLAPTQPPAKVDMVPIGLSWIILASVGFVLLLILVYWCYQKREVRNVPIVEQPLIVSKPEIVNARNKYIRVNESPRSLPRVSECKPV